MDVVFWLSFSVVFYTYIGFFALVFLLSRLRSNPVRKADITPSVTLVIAAYNEERVIREKLENTLRLEYPPDKLQVIVVTDGSDDRTPEVVREYSDRGVLAMHEPERRGKTMALNRAVGQATGEILLFSDANTHYAPDTVRMMVRNFHDDRVGAVSGRKVIRSESERVATAGEKGFWGYESSLKAMETSLGSISTADGEILAVRRALFEPIPKHIVHDDMFITLRLVRAGWRVVYEWDALSEEAASRSLKDEFFLKTRYASAGYQLVSEFRGMLLPPRSFFAFQFLSHKLLRWLAPVFLILLFVSSGLAESEPAHLLFWCQVAFYGLALVGFALMRVRLPAGPLYFPSYFCMGNGAALYGIWRLLTGGQSSLWRKAER